MTTYYSPGQLEVVLPFLRGRAPKWFILGGPADANEAQTAREFWPEVKVIGLEPNPEAYRWQLDLGDWPKDGRLFPFALAEKPGFTPMVFETGRLRNASTDPAAVTGNAGTSGVQHLTVPTTTLDRLDAIYGPFTDAVVWLDIEGSEYRALQGATALLERRAVLLWNLEMLSRVPGMMDDLPALLARHGYTAVHDWNDSEPCRDRIFVRDDLLGGK